MNTIRDVIAFPFMALGAIALLLFGLRSLFLVLNILGGVPIGDAVWEWLTSGLILGVVAFVSGGIATAIRFVGRRDMELQAAPAEPNAAPAKDDDRMLFGPAAPEVLG